MNAQRQSGGWGYTSFRGIDRGKEAQRLPDRVSRKANSRS